MQALLRRATGFAGYYASFFYYLILLPFFDRTETEERFRSRLQKAIRLSLRGFGVKVIVTGQENLCDSASAIVVANHSSWFDQLALVAALDRPISFMVNPKYFRFWCLANVLRKLGCIPVSPQSDVQGPPVAESLASGRQLLERGKWLVIFPEGTRSTSLLPFRRGAAVLSQQTGFPLQPIIIHGALQILPRARSLFDVRPGEIRLEILPPKYMDQTDTAKAIISQIEAEFAVAQHGS
ncbi:MAG: lysophospholipid acyltransferase family protein [Planctomycetota bacterium]